MLPTVKDIIISLDFLKEQYKFGVAGSYARGTAKKLSDIDIVIDTDILSIDLIERIKTKIKLDFNKKSDVIYLKLLRQDDIDLDNLALSVGLEINDCSAYKNIIKEVVWYDEVV